MKEGWKKYNLMDICNVTTGKHDANHADEDGKYRFYTCSSQYVYCNTKKYEGECIILPGNGVNVGESYYYNGEFDAYQRTYVIDKINKCIIPLFLYYHLQNNWKSEGVAKQYGSATNYIKIGNFKDYIVKAPQTLSEQQSIVDYLDSAFAKIDAMKANAEKALNEAKALFQASLKEMLEPKEGWEEKPLKEISNYSIGLTYKPTDVSDNGTIVLRSSNIQNDKLDLNDIVRVTCPIKDNLYVQEGDILMCSRNGSAKLVGKVTIIPETTERMTYGTFMMIIRGDYNPFLFYFFKSDDFRNQIKHGEANMINQITRYMLDDVVVYVPPITEQQSIVATLDSLKYKANRLQENYDKISQECDALKQAILRQVFE